MLRLVFHVECGSRLDGVGAIESLIIRVNFESCKTLNLSKDLVIFQTIHVRELILLVSEELIFISLLSSLPGKTIVERLEGIGPN